MKYNRLLAIILLAVLLLCLTGCKKDPVEPEREAMEEKYDVNGADPCPNLMSCCAWSSAS